MRSIVAFKNTRSDQDIYYKIKAAIPLRLDAIGVVAGAALALQRTDRHKRIRATVIACDSQR